MAKIKGDMETKEITIPQGWEIDKVEDNKVFLKESKKELPKTMVVEFTIKEINV